MTVIRIRYCTKCHWMLRSSWMAQELLSTFPTQIAEMILEPGTGGIFEIWLGDEMIWERKRDGGFPDIRILKQMVRDRICPDESLGHVDQV
ncbi:SelT/SelW/SelH family protein [Oscillatoria laete-virens NRMC-F 0139]|nr:SelT/SelW/SelH family protein [Oscillatoria laete-virens]MDL5053155.1 SelT/SelW/SelH family protein [Oscillatoria laete-virens NRMC-F 0139]